MQERRRQSAARTLAASVKQRGKLCAKHAKQSKVRQRSALQIPSVAMKISNLKNRSLTLLAQRMNA